MEIIIRFPSEIKVLRIDPFFLYTKNWLCFNYSRKVNAISFSLTVVIYLPKCLSFPTCYIGIMKAGGGYLPLDISNPDALLMSVLEDATPKCIITTVSLAQEKMKKILEESGSNSKLFIIDDDGFWRDELDNNGDYQTFSVNYTSGQN